VCLIGMEFPLLSHVMEVLPGVAFALHITQQWWIQER
jgi:hypothetical protein